MTWPTKKLGEVAEFQKGKMMPNTQINSVGSTPYILIDDLRNNNYAHFTSSSMGTACYPKDTLLVWDGANAGTVGGNLRGFVGSTITKISPLKDLDPKFLRLFLFSKSGEFNKQVHGAAIPHLNKNFVYQLLTPVPPAQIQKIIVERLDAIRKAQEVCDTQIQKADELFQSLLHQELNPAGRKWEVKKLVDILKPQYGYTAAAKEAGNYRFIRITDIGDDGELRDSDKKYVTLSQDEAQNYQLRNGDLLLARTGATFGKILYFKENEPSIFASFLIRLNPDTSINPFYIWLFSRSQGYWRQAKSLMTGSGQPQFNANKLKQIKIPLPLLEIQKQIVTKLSAVQEYKKQLLTQKSKLKELFDSVLYKSMRGEIDN